jgi:hypothetical protein
MNRRYAVKRTAVAFLLAGILMPSLGPATAPSRAQAIAAAGLAATLLKALPTIGTVISNLFKPTTKTTQTQEQKDKTTQMQAASAESMKQLQIYVKREQILATLVAASGSASGSVAKMNQIIAGQPQLTQSEMDDLNTNLWPDVTEALDNIAQSKPTTSVFDSDSLQIRAINNILSADKALKAKIALQLKYDPKKPDATLLKGLQANLLELETRFSDLRTVTAIELNMVADQLAAVATTSPATANPEPKPKSTEDASAQMMKLSFGDGSLLKSPISKSLKSLTDSVKTQVAVQ